MWKLDEDEAFFRIFDSQKYIAGYFDPEYGEGASEDEIAEMLKREDPVLGGYLVVPMIKFSLFDSDLNIDIETLEDRLEMAGRALARWSNYLKAKNYPFHSIRISHTDQDMLTMTFPVQFRRPVRLHKKDLAVELTPTLDSLQRLGLL